MASPLEQTSTDLRMARLVVHKLGETFDSFQVHSCSIFSLAEQWRNLEASFTETHKSLENRVKELESKERENCVVANKLQIFQKEVELKRKNLELGEKSLSEKIAKVELGQNEVKKWLEVIEVQKRGIIERRKAVEAKERELVDGLERVKKVDDEEIRVKKFQLEVDEWRKAVELEESRVNKVAEELGSREKQIDERSKGVELRESQVDERCKAVDLRENHIDERCKELDLKAREVKESEKVLVMRETKLNEEIRATKGKEKRLIEDHNALKLREQEMDDLYSLLELRENEINERFKDAESKDKGLKIREEDMEAQYEELKSKEKDLIMRLDVLKVKEKIVVDGCNELKMRENEINERFAALVDKESKISGRFASLEVREEEINKRSHDVELKEMQVNAQCTVVKTKEGLLNDQWEMLELKGKEIDERSKAMKLKEKEMGELYGELELKEKQMNEGRQGLESKQLQIDERIKEVEVKEKEISECYNKIEMTEKQLSRRKKVQELREKQFEDSSNALELKKEEVDGRWQMVEQKEKQLNELSAVLESKEDRFKQQNELSQILEVKEKHINELSETLASKQKQLDDLFEVLQSKEKQLNELSQAQESKETWQNELSQLLELKEKQINDLSESLASKQKQLKELFEVEQSKEKQLKEFSQMQESKEKQQNELAHILELKEKQINDLSESLASKQKQLKELFEVEQSKENQLKKLFQTQDLKEKQQNELENTLELKEKQINELSEALTFKQNQLNELSQERKSEEKQIGGHAVCDNDKVIDLTEEELHVSCEARELKGEKVDQQHGMQNIGVEKEKVCSDKLKVKGKQMTDGALNLKLNQTSNQQNISASKEGKNGDIAHKSRDKQTAELHKAVDVKGNHVNDMARNNEVGKKQLQKCDNNLVVNHKGSEASGSIFRAMDGKALQLYLNERVNKHGSMNGEVVEVLKSTINPAKLVLEAIDGFFAPHLCKDGVVFEASVVRSSCLLLLEQLMNLKPVVTKAVRKEACIVAVKWKAKMKVQGESEVIVLAFLLLLVTYKMNTLVKKDDLRRLCGIVDKHRLAPCLRQRLGVLTGSNVSSGFEAVIKEAVQLDVTQVANALDTSSLKISSDIHSLCRSMNQKGVRSYLIEHVKEYDVLHDNILDALRNAADPAKLVLGVCQIALLDLDKSRAGVNNTVWIFLLNQLMKLSPSISQELTIEAKNIAAFLKTRLKGSNCPTDHYKFLQFVASFKLGNSYNPDDLLSHFNFFYYGTEVYRAEENVHLCMALGLAKKIPGLIKSLINRQKLLIAVKYICAFKLERSFPPVPLLEVHLEIVKKKVDQQRQNGTFREKIDAERLEAKTLNHVLACISNFKLQAILSPEPFIARVKELELEKERRMGKNFRSKRCASPRPCIATPLQQEKRPRLGVVQQSQPIAPMCLPPCPSGPPPLSHSYGPPHYGRAMSNAPNKCFNSRGDHGDVAPRHFAPVMLHNGSSMPIYRVNDQAWTVPHQQRF